MAENPATDAQSPPLKTALTVLTLLSTLVTVGLSVGTYFLKQRLDIAEHNLKERVQNLEEARANIARYEYVYQLLSKMEKGSSSQRTLSVNMARLVLKTEEQETLFNGLLLSDDVGLADAGRQGVAVLSQPSPKHATGPDKVEERPSPPPVKPSVVPPPSQMSELPSPPPSPPPPSPPPPPPVLSAATIVLHTTSDDKDEGTFVSITISSDAGELFKWQDDSGEAWGKVKRIDLHPVTALPFSRLEHPKIAICMTRKDKPHGWKFDYTGDLFVGKDSVLSFKHKRNEIAHSTGTECLHRPLL